MQFWAYKERSDHTPHRYIYLTHQLSRMAAPAASSRTLGWLHERLGRKWTADSLASLLDVPLLSRLADLWPTLPGGPGAVLKPRIILSLSSLKSPVTEEMRAGARRLLDVAAADTSEGSEWGRIAVGLVARSCPVIFGGAAPPDSLTAYADAVIDSTVEDVLPHLTGLDDDTPLSLSELPIELRLLAPSAAVSQAWDYRRDLHFVLAPHSREAQRLHNLDSVLHDAAQAVRSTHTLEGEVAAAAAAEADGAEGGGSSGLSGDLNARQVEAGAASTRAARLLMAYVMGGDTALSATVAEGDRLHARQQAQSTPASSGAATAHAALSAAFAGAGVVIATGATAAGRGGLHLTAPSISYKRQREAPAAVELEALRDSKRISLAAASQIGGVPATAAAARAAPALPHALSTSSGGAVTGTSSVRQTAVAAATSSISVAVGATSSSSRNKGLDAVSSQPDAFVPSRTATTAATILSAAHSTGPAAALPAASFAAHPAAAATAAAPDTGEGGAPPAPNVLPPVVVPLKNEAALLARISNDQSPLLTPEARAAVLRFIEDPRGAPSDAAAAVVATRKASYTLSETSVKGKDGALVSGFAVLELNYAEGSWRTLFKKRS